MAQINLCILMGRNCP